MLLGVLPLAHSAGIAPATSRHLYSGVVLCLLWRRYIYRHRRQAAHRTRAAVAARLATATAAASPPRTQRHGSTPTTAGRSGDPTSKARPPAGPGAGPGADDASGSVEEEHEDSDVGPLPLRMQRIEEGVLVDEEDPGVGGPVVGGFAGQASPTGAWLSVGFSSFPQAFRMHAAHGW